MGFRKSFSSGYLSYVKATSIRAEGLQSYAIGQNDVSSQGFSAAGPCSCACTCPCACACSCSCACTCPCACGSSCFTPPAPTEN